MVSSEYQDFSALMDRAARVYRPSAPVSELVDDYWRALEAFPLVAVEAGLTKLLETAVHFPKPAEWRKAIPRRILASATYRVLSDGERTDYLRAKALSWEDAPCPCEPCVRAGVDEKPLRFAPCETLEQTWLDDTRQQVVVPGDWLHGELLQRWYAARDVYLALKTAWSDGRQPVGGWSHLRACSVDTDAAKVTT